jgi:hypothetical protein
MRVKASPLILIAVLLALLAGCATRPDTPRDVGDAIALGYTMAEISADSVADLHASGILNDVQRTRYRINLQAAKDNLDLASTALAAGRLLEAEDRLRQANLILTAIETALRQQQ